MKLLIQSDDYGASGAIARGIIRAIEYGTVRNTGIFINMPWAKEAAEWIQPYLDNIAFGIDLNAVQGVPVLGRDAVPSLCREDGSFLSIAENRFLDSEENGYDHVNDSELYAEWDGQIREFIRICGRKPDYIHPHAYVTKKTETVQRKLAQEYGIPYSMDMKKLPDVQMPSMGWYTHGTMEQQLNEDPLTYFLEDRSGYLKHEYGMLITHCGELDSDALRLPFNICRLRDLEAVTDPRFRKWIAENGIELITYHDICEMITK